MGVSSERTWSARKRRRQFSGTTDLTVTDPRADTDSKGWTPEQILAGVSTFRYAPRRKRIISFTPQRYISANVEDKYKKEQTEEVERGSIWAV